MFLRLRFKSARSNPATTNLTNFVGIVVAAPCGTAVSQTGGGRRLRKGAGKLEFGFHCRYRVRTLMARA